VSVLFKETSRDEVLNVGLCVFAPKRQRHDSKGQLQEVQDFMKRFGEFCTCVFLASIIAGCGEGGIPAGSPAEIPKSSQTDQFKEAMQNAGNKMLKKQMGKKAFEPTKKAEPKAAEKSP
jgi:hypothetical protein